MINDNRIIFRLDSDLKNILEEKIKKDNTKLSIILKKLVEDYIKGNNKEVEFEIKKDFEERKRKFNLLKQAKKLKEKLRCYYLIKNTQVTLYRICSSLIFNSGGDINMAIVRDILDGVNEIYKTFPEDIKINLENDLNCLNEMRSRDILNTRMRLIKNSIDLNKNKLLGDKNAIHKTDKF